MRKFKNINTGKILTEREYTELLMSEYIEMWYSDANTVVEDMKDEGKTVLHYIKYMIDNDCDSDFEVVEEDE